MLAPKSRLYSQAEYLALEEQAEVKSEYWQGRLVAMTGGSLNHNRIAGNVYAALNTALTGEPCEAFIGDVRVRIEPKDIFTYPDVMVVCSQPDLWQDRTDTLTNPKVIVEVLSKSTAGYDRGDKFQTYWSLDSLAEHIIIDQDRVRVEYFRRISEKEWRLLVLSTTGEVLNLESVSVEIPVDSIYRNITWTGGEQP